MASIFDKFRSADHLHWLILICWTCGVVALTGLWLMVRA